MDTEKRWKNYNSGVKIIVDDSQNQFYNNTKNKGVAKRCC